jgi:phage gp37-like protein
MGSSRQAAWKDSCLAGQQNFRPAVDSTAAFQDSILAIQRHGRPAEWYDRGLANQILGRPAVWQAIRLAS